MLVQGILEHWEHFKFCSNPFKINNATSQAPDWIVPTGDPHSIRIDCIEEKSSSVSASFSRTPQDSGAWALDLKLELLARRVRLLLHR